MIKVKKMVMYFVPDFLFTILSYFSRGFQFLGLMNKKPKKKREEASKIDDLDLQDEVDSVLEMGETDSHLIDLEQDYTLENIEDEYGLTSFIEDEVYNESEVPNTKKQLVQDIREYTGMKFSDCRELASRYKEYMEN